MFTFLENVGHREAGVAFGFESRRVDALFK